MKKILEKNHKLYLYNEGTVIIDTQTDHAYLHDERWYSSKRNEDEVEEVSFKQLPLHIQAEYLQGLRITNPFEKKTHSPLVGGSSMAPPQSQFIKNAKRSFSIKKMLKLFSLMFLISVSIVLIGDEFTGPQIAWFALWSLVLVLSLLGIGLWYMDYLENQKRQ